MPAMPPVTLRPTFIVPSVRLAAVTLIAALALALAACSSGDEASSPETLPTSTESPTASGASTSTTSTAVEAESTTTTVSIEDEVLAAHEHFMTEYFDRDESALTLEERIARVEAVAVDPLLARVLERTATRDQDGSYAISPGYESNVVEVEVDGETASVLDCSLDLGVLYDANGDELIGADEEHHLRRTVWLLTDDGWFVSDFFTGGDECTPDV